MRYLLASFALAMSGCAQEPTPKEAEVAADIQADVTPQKQLEDEARKIEQAAEEAVKLIEAEAKAETDRNPVAAE